MKIPYHEDSIWKFKHTFPLASRLAGEMNISPLQALLMTNRGILNPSQASDFMNPRLSRLLDPMLLKGMEEALNMISGSMDEGIPITIYGDYDADGISSTALMVHFFSRLGVDISYYIPHRLKEGYGLNKEAIKKIAKRGGGLIITVDCGISGKSEVSFARSLGLRVVVTDHHECENVSIPDCPCINPKQEGCPFPFKDLAGVGVAFFLAVALRARLRKRGWFKIKQEPDLRMFLDLVALGTIADSVSLSDQNRILVSNGLMVMSGSTSPGLEAMKSLSGLAGNEVSSEDVAFKIAPRINAPGRIDNPRLVMSLLTARTYDDARRYALEMEKANNHRKAIEKDMLESIEERILLDGTLISGKIILMKGKEWHRGVLGIVASRLVSKYNRPSFVSSEINGDNYGSARSIEGFDIFAMMNRMRAVFSSFGGHEAAAGFSMKREIYPAFEKGMHELAEELLTRDKLLRSFIIDAEVGPKDITSECISVMKPLEPYGAGNPRPLFLTKSLEVEKPRVICEEHLKFKARAGSFCFDVIGFGMGHRELKEGSRVDILHIPEINTWNGCKNIQLKMADFRRSEP